MGYCCGLDWGGSVHAVCVIDDADGHVVARFTIDHTADGLAELRRRLDKIASGRDHPDRHRAPLGPARRHAGRGRPPGRADPSQRRQGLPPALPRRRRQERSAATPTCSPTSCAPTATASAPLEPRSDEIKALRALVRGRDDLVAARVALANQLRSLLEGFWPGAAAIFADIDSPIALAFLAALSDA